jgi:hypothetical protein
VTVVANRSVQSTSKSRLPTYFNAVRKLLDLSEDNARLLAARLAMGTTAFSPVPLDLHPAGVSKSVIASYKNDLRVPVKALEARFRLDQANRINECRQREFRVWLQSAEGMPSAWVDRMVGSLRPEVTYVNFMPEVDTLLVEHN